MEIFFLLSGIAVGAGLAPLARYLHTHGSGDVAGQWVCLGDLLSDLRRAGHRAHPAQRTGGRHAR
jgi:hypothetical protein